MSVKKRLQSFFLVIGVFTLVSYGGADNPDDDGDGVKNETEDAILDEDKDITIYYDSSTVSTAKCVTAAGTVLPPAELKRASLQLLQRGS